jgi:hypothetical protein
MRRRVGALKAPRFATSGAFRNIQGRYCYLLLNWRPNATTATIPGELRDRLIADALAVLLVDKGRANDIRSSGSAYPAHTWPG